MVIHKDVICDQYFFGLNKYDFDDNDDQCYKKSNKSIELIYIYIYT